MATDDIGAIPPSVIENLTDFHEKITKLEEAYKPILQSTLEISQVDKSPLEKAKLDLLALYAVNAAFWSYSCTKGINPKDTPVIQELERVKNFKEKIRQIEDRSKAPKLDKKTAQSFIRNALFDPKAVAMASTSSTVVRTETTNRQNMENSRTKVCQQHSKTEVKKHKRVKDSKSKKKS